MNENKNIQEIILRYLNGESSEEEAGELHEWIEEDAAHAEEFEEIRRLWDDTADAALLPVDTERAWQKVSAKTIEYGPKVVKIFPWRRAIAIAASIIFIIGVYYFFNQTFKPNWNVTLAENANKQIELPDGTFIVMRKGSKLSVPDNFGKEKREVKIEGEAYFKVMHNAGNPFSAVTPKSIIRDIGTAFLIHSSDSLEQVTVMEGEVSFEGKKLNKSAVILKVGESAVLKNNIPEKEKIDTTNALSWSTGILNFNSTPLLQVVKDLEDYFKIKVELPEQFDSMQITAEFRQDSLEQVLEELQLFTSLKFTMSENTLVISK